MDKADLLKFFNIACIFGSLGISIISNELTFFIVSEFDFIFKKIGFFFFIIFLFSTMFFIVSELLRYRIWNGYKYFLVYRKSYNSLKKQLIHADIFLKNGDLIVPPKIMISFSDDLKFGEILIQNSIRFEDKLSNIDLSSSLSDFIVENHFLSDDRNTHIFKLSNSSINYKLVFNTFSEFCEHSKTLGDYQIFLDSRSTVKLQHTLLVGQTGSGKTYSLYSLVLQMLLKKVNYNLFFADPKGSSLLVLGKKIENAHVAETIDEIVDILKLFVNQMNLRKKEVKTKLESKLDADFSDFNLEPYVFIFDEYASFVSVLDSKPKKERDEIYSLITQIVLQGRQLGFFIMIVMQKSDSNLISTAIRNNLPLKIVLGNAESTTYQTAFGSTADVPPRFYQIGEGVFVEPRIAPKPKMVYFPQLNFDILKSLSATPVM